MTGNDTPGNAGCIKREESKVSVNWETEKGSTDWNLGKFKDCLYCEYLQIKLEREKTEMFVLVI